MELGSGSRVEGLKVQSLGVGDSLGLRAESGFSRLSAVLLCHALAATVPKTCSYLLIGSGFMM